MDESAARRFLADELNVSRETLARLEAFVEFLTIENENQNLVSKQSLGTVWARHIADSAQLIRFAPGSATWLDLGTGAGFPGLIIALLHRSKVTMVESRAKRAEFLRQAAALLGLGGEANLVCARVETLEASPFDVISARAFAPLDRILALGERFATPATRWILPKGRNAKSELEAVESSWQGDFRIEPSLTDGASHIIVAEQVRRKGTGRRRR